MVLLLLLLLLLLLVLLLVLTLSPSLLAKTRCEFCNGAHAGNRESQCGNKKGCWEYYHGEEHIRIPPAACV